MIALLRTELTKAVRRTRTLVIAVALVALPTLIVIAIRSRGDRGRRGGGDGLFRLATQSGLLVPAAVLSAMSGFLLVVIAGMLAGDSVAADAGWGNLRYLLMRPVSRTKLLLAKGAVAGLLIWAVTFLVALAALVAGVLSFGAHPVSVPFVAGNFSLSTGELVTRTALAALYVAVGYTALLAMGVLFSTLTDTATGAIGATIGVYIVSEVLDAVDQLDTLRYGFPTHYLGAWTSMFTQDRYSQDLLAGVVVQLVYLVVFGAAAVVWFRRKDIRS